MNRLIFFVFCLSLFASCDDGDVIVTTFDFEDSDLQQCQGSDGFLFFQINEAGTESLSLRLNISEDLFTEESETEIELNGSNNFSNYRIYNGSVDASYFCNEVPPISPPVEVEYLSSSGIATATVVLILDDNDGLPFIDSDDPNVEGTGDFDGDGIPNYLDADDDGDNVLTKDELDTEDLDGDGDPLTNPKNTDSLMDEIPDYLDKDDDGDGVPTINEDADEDLNPTNDVSDPNVGPDYLNPQVSNEVITTAYRENTYTYSSNLRLVLSNMSFANENEQITRETIDMGSILGIDTDEVSETPDFED